MSRIRKAASSSLDRSFLPNLDNPVNPVYFFSALLAILNGWLTVGDVGYNPGPTPARCRLLTFYPTSAQRLTSTGD
jgi:hypothetical protein